MPFPDFSSPVWTSENSFRIAFLVIVAVQLPVALVCMRRASAMGTIFRRRAEGIVMTLLLGGAYAAYSLAGIIYLVEPDWMAWSAIPLPSVVRWSGALLAALGASLAVPSLMTLGRNFAFAVVPQEHASLVTSGTYAWIRHPLYSAFLIETVGASVLMANVFVAATGLLTWGLLAVRTRQEEDELVERFGDAYRCYMRRVGRFFPRFR